MELGNVFTGENLALSFLGENTQLGQIPPLSDLSQQGVFEVGAEGTVEIDFLFDGGEREGEIGIFNLANMPTNLQEFKNEALARALSNSSDLGFVVISDLTEGARITGATLHDEDHNQGTYNGSKSFSLDPNTQFGLVLSPGSSLQDAITNPNASEIVFSIPEANFNQAIQLAQVPTIDSEGVAFIDTNTFAFEDMTGMDSDKDFNDAILQIKGATGSATQLDEVINPERDWRGFESGRQILELVGRQKEEEISIVANPPVITEPPDEKPPISIEPPPSDEGGSNNPGDGEIGEEGGGESAGEEELVQSVVEDKAGDTLLEARPTAISSDGKLYQDNVSVNDGDYYNFVLGATTILDISVNGMGEDITLKLLDSEGNEIETSQNEGTKEATIKKEVGGSRYNILVTSDSTEPVAYTLKIIATSPEGVKIIGSEEISYLQTKESLPLIDAEKFGTNSEEFNSALQYSDLDGTGYSVVVIDSGINAEHPAFGDRIIYSQSFVSGGGNSDASDTGGHGTNVASIIASQDEKYPGIASNVNIISLKVINEQDEATNWDIEQALSWVEKNAEKYNIVAVNLSLGINKNLNTFTYDDNRGYSSSIKDLTDKGIIVVAAAGNNYKEYEKEGLNYPAADPNTIAVGAVYDSDVGKQLSKDGAIDEKTRPDKIASFSQRSENLSTVFAPGALITGAGLNQWFLLFANYNVTNLGTSQAAPHVTGMAVLAQQLAEKELGRKLSPQEFRELLISTGEEITDEETEDDNVKNTGLTFSRVNMTNLAEAISDSNLVKVELLETKNNLNSQSRIFAKIKVDNSMRKTNSAPRAAASDWMYVKSTSSEVVPIEIELFTSSELQEQIDINPKENVRSINLLYDTTNGNIYDQDNNQNHFEGEEIRRAGNIAEEQTEIAFRISTLNEKKPVKVNISRVKGELDRPILDGSLFGASDFFPVVSIDSEEVVLEGIENQNEINPDWSVVERVSNKIEEIPINIRILDDDADGWLVSNENDELNINPNSDKKNDLSLIYNQNSGDIRDEITGQVYGRRGEEIRLIGSDGKGEIWFSIT